MSSKLSSALLEWLCCQSAFLLQPCHPSSFGSHLQHLRSHPPATQICSPKHHCRSAAGQKTKLGHNMVFNFFFFALHQVSTLVSVCQPQQCAHNRVVAVQIAAGVHAHVHCSCIGLNLKWRFELQSKHTVMMSVLHMTAFDTGASQPAFQGAEINDRLHRLASSKEN